MRRSCTSWTPTRWPPLSVRGGISEDSERRMVHLAQAAEAAHADVIVSTCSSLGPTLDAASRAVAIPVVKIDEAMAIEATGHARVGVLATVPTTLKPTSDLIAEKARQAGRDVEITAALCDGAFQILMSVAGPLTMPWCSTTIRPEVRLSPGSASY